MIVKENAGFSRSDYSCSMLFDLIHSEGAETLAVYAEEFYAGMPWRDA